RIFTFQIFRELVQFGLRLLESHTRFQTAFDAQTPKAAILERLWVAGQTRPHVERNIKPRPAVSVGSGEFRARHTDHREIDARNPDVPANHAGIRAEPFPKPMTQNHHRVAAWNL